MSAAPTRAAPVSTGRVAAAVAMPLADLTALTAAAAVAGLAGGLSGWLVAGYAAAVFLVLSAIGLHRLRICLRVCDQSGRIIVAVAAPALAVAPWHHGGARGRRSRSAPPGCCSPPGWPPPRSSARLTGTAG